MRNDDHKLKFFQPFLIFTIFIVGLAILLLGLSQISKSRKNSIYQTYALETQQYINQNHEQLVTLFTRSFPNTDCIDNSMPCEQPPDQNYTAHLLPSTLKDWSSTVFLRNNNGKIWIMRLSGENYEINVYPPEKQMLLQKLLTGENTQIEWDDYIYELSGKEVIIPVKDNNGKVIGAIARSVIEPQ